MRRQLVNNFGSFQRPHFRLSEPLFAQDLDAVRAQRRSRARELGVAGGVAEDGCWAYTTNDAFHIGVRRLDENPAVLDLRSFRERVTGDAPPA